jgi:metallo-beta-lactamase class B
MTPRVVLAFAMMAAAGIASAGVTRAGAQAADDTIDGHLRAAKRAAAFEFRGLLGALCVAPQNRPPPDVPPPPPPDRTRFYTEPGKMFDDVYFVGTRDRSSWVLPTSDGLILIDTTFEYETEPVIVGEEARLRSGGRQIRHHHPRPSRRGRRRQDDAGPLRLAYRHGRGRLGHDRELGQSVS